jgi:hypothetical protein
MASNYDPPETGSVVVADGRWHRFGEAPVAVANASRETAAPEPRVSSAVPVRAAFVGDGQWHRFGEKPVVASSTRKNLAPQPRPSKPDSKGPVYVADADWHRFGRQ